MKSHLQARQGGVELDVTWMALGLNWRDSIQIKNRAYDVLHVFENYVSAVDLEFPNSMHL